MNITEIGLVKSSAAEGKDEGWGEVAAEIHLKPEFAAGLRGIEQFSHLLVVFWMHESSFNPANDLVRRPRGRADMPEVGIFAQRAKHRPNPIGITTVEIVEISDNVLKVKGLDAINGTPVLDIKPYFSEFDSINNPRTPRWVSLLMQNYF